MQLTDYTAPLERPLTAYRQESSAPLDNLLHSKSRILRDKLEVLASEICTRLNMWDRNLARIDSDKENVENFWTSSPGWLVTIFATPKMSPGSTNQTCGLKRNDAMKMSSAGAMLSWLCVIFWKPGKPTSRPRTAPFSSTMWEQEIRNLCKKLKPLLGKRADGLWTAYITAETPRSKQEAEALIQLLAAQYLSRQRRR